MHFAHTIVVKVSVDQVWQSLWDVQRLAGLIPGVSGVTEVVFRQRYAARVSDRLGPFRVTFDLNIAVEEAEVGRLLRLSVTGQDRLVGGSLKQGLTVQLSEAEPDVTELCIDTDVTVLGKLGALGHGLIERKVREIMSGFSGNLVRELEGGGPSATTVSSV